MIGKTLCSCGWQRPLIALTTTDGTELPPNVAPICVCPSCATIHAPKEISIDAATRILRDLVDELTQCMAAATAARGDA